MISGVILARNEEDNITDCIHALRPHVSEILLIDMESEDRTAELARPYVNRILPHPLCDDFDAARNIANDTALHNWLWFVDADERIPPQVGNHVSELVRQEGDSFEALFVPFKSYFCGQWIQHSGWWPGYTMPRVLKRGHFRFRDRLHGGVEVHGRTRFLPPDPDLGVDHFSYRDLSHYVEKFNPYTSREATILNSQGDEYSWEAALRSMMRDMHGYYEANEGHRDGALGWVLAWLAGQYRWMSHTKLIDVNGGPNGDEPPLNIKQVLDVLKSELSRQESRLGKLTAGDVVLRTPLWDYSGYADDGRQVAKALARTERRVRCEPLPWNSTSAELATGERALLKALTGVEKVAAPICITNGIPGMFGPDPDAAYNILRTTFETDRIPNTWRDHLAEFDEVWVFSEQSAKAFRRGGAAPEQIRIVPSAVDTGVFKPTGKKTPVPKHLRGRFVFLSTFDWQLRKGWDVLLAAYCEAFDADAGMALQVKITSLHGQPWEMILKQTSEFLETKGVTLADRPDIHLYQDDLTQEQMAGLYRAVDTFVLPTRGEGWGRPIMEAMACGTPVLVPRTSGQAAFVNEDNACVIESISADVKEDAARELPVYAGHRWVEPYLASCVQGLKRLASDSDYRKCLSHAALKTIRSKFSVDALSGHLDRAIASIESENAPYEQNADENATRVRLEGEFFSGHSFANINETLVEHFANRKETRITASLRQTPDAPVARRRRQIVQGCINSDHECEVRIRHAFPPDWSAPDSGYWVHIQPWEFGRLPRDWVGPLQSLVDEVWAPTNYVKDVYVRSGIDAEKVHVVPWGIDPEVYRPDVTSLAITERKSFAFLFVGGTIPRKGFDRVLKAFTEEFGADEDVCLVVKDLGAQTFYRHGNYRDAIAEHNARGDGAKIVYLDHDMTDGQRASLYAACDCLAMPYRGEGFGLPILEAMACGVAPIVPRGGASDDFTDESTAFYVDSQEKESDHDWRLVGPAMELDVDLQDIRHSMRQAFECRERTREVGQAASRFVHLNFTWRQTVDAMQSRIDTLVQSERPYRRSEPTQSLPASLTTCVVVPTGEAASCVETLATATAVSAEVLALVDHEDADGFALVSEYATRVFASDTSAARSPLTNSLLKKSTSELNLVLHPGEGIAADDIPRLRDQLPAMCGHHGPFWCDIVSCDGSLVTREIRIFENTSQLIYPFASGFDIGNSVSDIAHAQPSGVRLEITDAACWTENRRPCELHRDLVEYGHHWSVLWALGVRHLSSGNPFQAECFLADALNAAPKEHPLRNLLYSQLAHSHHLIDNPFARDEIVRQARSELGEQTELPAIGAPNVESESTKRLYLGAGNKTLPGYLGVDLKASPTISIVANLNELPWPWEDDSVDHVVAEDVVEHLAIDPIAFCSEAWRVLKPGGELYIRTPHHSGDSSWIDPTHRWHLNEQSFDYLDPDTHWGQVHPQYTDRKWRILSRGVRGPQNIHITMTPRK